MNNEQIIQRVLSIGERCFNHTTLKPGEQKFLLDSYYQFTGIKLVAGCGSCFITIYQYFKTKHNSNLQTSTNMSTKNCQFKLAPGKVISLHGLAHVYTNANLTDDAALDILKRAPRVIGWFTEYPPDWEQQAEARYKSVMKKHLSDSTTTDNSPSAPSAAPVKFDNKEFNLPEMKLAHLKEKSMDVLKKMCAQLEIVVPENASKKKLIELLSAKIG